MEGKVPVVMERFTIERIVGDIVKHYAAIVVGSLLLRAGPVTSESCRLA